MRKPPRPTHIKNNYKKELQKKETELENIAKAESENLNTAQNYNLEFEDDLDIIHKRILIEREKLKKYKYINIWD